MIFRRFSSTLIKANEYIQRRTNLIKLIKEESASKTDLPITIVIPSAKLSYSAPPDVPHPFRQDAHFRYLSGITIPDSKLIIVKDNGAASTVLFLKSETEHDKIWNGIRTSDDQLKSKYGIDQILPLTEYQKFLESRKNSTFVFNQAKDYDTWELNLFIASSKKTTLKDKIDRLQWIKSDTEIELMRKTCLIGSQAMNSVIKQGKNLDHENSFVGALEFEMRRRGASSLAYPPVVGSGHRANFIHYLHANQPILPGQTVLIDAGCEYEGYSSDITRCFPITGSFTPAQRELYEALNQVQTDCLTYCRNFKPLLLSDLYFFMLKQMAEYFNEIHIFKNTNHSEEELLHITNDLCPHHISHYLGMDVHDCSSVARNIPLKAGVVFTVEPGVYVTKDNKFVRNEFMDIGYRIEDDVLTTEDGVEVLTESCIRNADDIEYTMKSII
uniref:AMP_N domain-containing protein n=1 Tax=Rhabditophanes sp. KR3021 TaxID=114890 RepID=A0AC35TGV4_9BILA